MPDKSSDLLRQQQMAISRWDGEGGAGPDGPQEASSEKIDAEVPESENAELVQLRARVIALENLMIALLANASDRQLGLAREMADYISPRPGFTQHSLTVRAAAMMTDLIERSAQFGEAPPAPVPYKRTDIFDENTLPAGLRREHRTKPGVWAVIRVLEGQLRYQVLEPTCEALILEPGRPGLVRPEEPHLVEPLGHIRMQVEFYDRLPEL